MSKSYLLTVTNITRETPQAVSLHFAIPEELREDFLFEAGQYLTLETEIEGKVVRRSYSLCSVPQSGTWSVVVKEVEDGYFSKYVNRQLQVGDKMKVFPPEGRFVIKPNPTHTHNYIAIVAGSGITPVFSMIQTILEKEPQSKFLLIYGNKTPQETIFYQNLQNLQRQNPERLFVEYVFSRVNEPNARFGRIDGAIINYFLKNKYSHFEAHSYYLCGPEELINTAKKTLTNNGVSEESIHFELFSSTPDTSAPVVKGSGRTTLTVVLDYEETTFEIPQTQTVLDAAIQKGLDPPYSCQGGICSSCVGRIIEGKAEMRKNQILTDSEVAEGLILTCQALPLTDTLKVDYDDV